MKARTPANLLVLPGPAVSAEAAAWLPVLVDTPRWLVCPHQGPDADTLGSSLALARLIEAKGGEAHVVCPEPLRARFDYLPGVERVRGDVPAAWDGGVVALDAAALSRLGDVAPLVADARPLVNVDHHVSNTRWGTHNLIDLDAAATGEIVFLMFAHFGVPLDEASATCLYAALLTDTGGFRYPTTTPRTLAVAAALLDAGVDAPRVGAAIYERRTPAAVRLLGEALASLRVSPDGRLAWVLVSHAMFARTGATEEEAEAIVERVREVAGVQGFFVARESRSGDIRVSLRSKGKLDVNRLAGRFGGGGHHQAAGCTLAMSLLDAEACLVDAFSAALSEEALA